MVVEKIHTAVADRSFGNDPAGFSFDELVGKGCLQDGSWSRVVPLIVDDCQTDAQQLAQQPRRSPILQESLAGAANIFGGGNCQWKWPGHDLPEPGLVKAFQTPAVVDQDGQRLAHVVVL